MDNIKKLEKFLNDCIKLWWVFGEGVKEIKVDNIWWIAYGSDGGCPMDLSMHDLFSVDSWLMEFVERKQRNAIQHIRRMSPMTAKEKVDYFLFYATLPEK